MFDGICQHKLGVLLTLVIAVELAMFLLTNEWMPWNW